jgi:hypothetical protein
MFGKLANWFSPNATLPPGVRTLDELLTSRLPSPEPAELTHGTAVPRSAPATKLGAWTPKVRAQPQLKRPNRTTPSALEPRIYRSKSGWRLKSPSHAHTKPISDDRLKADLVKYRAGHTPREYKFAPRSVVSLAYAKAFKKECRTDKLVGGAPRPLPEPTARIPGAHPALQYLPHLQGDINDFPRPNAPEPFFPEALVVRVEPIVNHLAAVNKQAVHDEVLEAIPSPEFRELFSPRACERTRQIADDPLLGVFPTHRPSDSATYSLTIKKRIQLASKAQNEANYVTRQIGGSLLFSNYVRHFELNPQTFDHDLYERCLYENETKHLDKDIATLLRNADRSDPDWPLNKVHIFVKSQVLKKAQNIGGPAKIGQTLASFRAQVLLKFGPYARYLATKIFSDLPDNIFINRQRSPRDLAEWCRQHWNDDSGATDGDYIAYDTKQDETALRFEEELMRHYGIPEHIIGDYVAMKQDLFCAMGHMAIARVTGEVFTFDFNTAYNIAYTLLKFDVPKNVAQAYGGDDKSVNCKLVVRQGWEGVARHFALEEVISYAKYGTFCGWILRSNGIIKSPRLLYWRSSYMAARFKPQNWAPSYAAELQLTLEAGHALEDLSDADQDYLRLLIGAYSRMVKKLPIVGRLCPLLKTHLYWTKRHEEVDTHSNVRVLQNRNQARWFATQSGMVLKNSDDEFLHSL